METVDETEVIAFEYNEDGLRTKKTVTVGNTTTVTEYVLHGKNVVHLIRGTDTMHFYYDAQSKPSIVVFNGTAYGYLYNLQGDVVALVDGMGAKVVEYGYDAWGKPISKTGTMAATLGTVQPFRYRGYVFDEETGDYYLRNRYYRAEWGRFLNADSHVSNCLYKYSLNNPIRYTDTSGNEPYDLFSNIEDLLLDFERLYNNKEIEYGAWIMRDRETGAYFYCTPSAGISAESLDDGIAGKVIIDDYSLEDYKKGEQYATVHTHGRYAGDKGSLIPSIVDAKTTAKSGIPCYVITPDKSIHFLIKLFDNGNALYDVYAQSVYSERYRLGKESELYPFYQYSDTLVDFWEVTEY